MKKLGTMKGFICLIVFAFGGCSAVTPNQEFDAIQLRANPSHLFEYSEIKANGTLWSFERNGSYLSFGGPLGFPAKDKILPAISVSNYDLELTDASQVAATKRDEIEDIFDTAEAYCLNSDYLLTAGNVVALYSHEEKLYLIGFCVPKNSQFAQNL